MSKESSGGFNIWWIFIGLWLFGFCDKEDGEKVAVVVKDVVQHVEQKASPETKENLNNLVKSATKLAKDLNEKLHEGQIVEGTTTQVLDDGTIVNTEVTVQTVAKDMNEKLEGFDLKAEVVDENTINIVDMKPPISFEEMEKLPPIEVDEYGNEYEVEENKSYQESYDYGNGVLTPKLD